MRTFIAIEISEEIRNALAQAQSHLKYAGADVKWVEPVNIHLTLKFLGEITEEKCAKVKAALDSVAAATKPFELSIKDIGAFPKIEYPRVIWIGLDKGAKETTEIAAKVDEGLSKLGFEKKSRPFAAHLTIGRVRSAKNRDALKEKVTSHKTQVTSPYLITSMILFQSTLTSRGSIYTMLHEAKFAR